jgi:N,N'-diacetyllegionaminate synthase
MIIAEAGVNHNGDVALARRLVREAARAGADAVKFQTFSARRIATPDAPKAPYQLTTTDAAETQVQMLERLELDPDAYPELMALCREHELAFLSTPYDTEDIDFLVGLDIPAIKLASIHVVETPMLRHAALARRPVLLSTGMATLAEVDRAVRTITESGHQDIVLLHCTTDYPARLEDANLRAITTLRAAFALPVGFSDHTTTTTAAAVAIGLGACVIEKHFTVDRSLPGPDQAASANPDEFAAFVSAVRDAERALGTGRKEPMPSELRNRQTMRRSIVARVPIRTGERITADMLAYKRPAVGLCPDDIDSVLGACARVDIVADRALQWWMLERA